MADSTLLHIDSSFQGGRSISRRLTARAAEAWRAAHPGGTVIYRDLGASPVPHVGPDHLSAGMVPAEQRTPEQAAARRAVEELAGEVTAASTILLGLPVYNYGAPSTVKTWVDHLILSLPQGAESPLGGRELIVLASRGGGYGSGTPREGWDHAEQWLPHGLSLTGLEPRFITAELTLAETTPAMRDLIPLMHESIAAAERAAGELWAPAAAAA